MGFSFRAHSPLKSLCDSHIPTQPGLRFCARAGRHAQSTTTITDPADLISDPMACVGCCREYPHGIECHCFAGGILACVAGSLNPHQGMILGALSAAASTFGGTSGLLLDDELAEREPNPFRLRTRTAAHPQELAVDCDCLRTCPVICGRARSRSTFLRRIRKLARISLTKLCAVFLIHADVLQAGRLQARLPPDECTRA